MEFTRRKFYRVSQMNTDSDWARSHTDAVLLTLAPAITLTFGNLWNPRLGFPCYPANLLPGTFSRRPVALPWKSLKSFNVSLSSLPSPATLRLAAIVNGIQLSPARAPVDDASEKAPSHQFPLHRVEHILLNLSRRSS